MLKNFNAREKRLALGLGVVIFLMLNLLFLPKLIAGNKARRQKNAELTAQVAAARTWVTRRDYWNERKAWLEKTEPILHAAREDSAAQLESFQKAAREHDVSLSDIQLLQLPAAEFYQPIGARLTVKGSWSGLVAFVSGLQNPELFNVIPRFSVRSDDPPPHVQCDLEVQRWLLIQPEGRQ